MDTFQGFPIRDVYEQAYMAKLGVSLEAFAEEPAMWLGLFGQRDAIKIMTKGHRPLLPQQVLLREEWIAQWRQEGAWDDNELPAVP